MKKPILIFFLIPLLGVTQNQPTLNTEKEIIVEPNSLLLIDNLSIIGDRDTKPSELNFNFNELPLPIPIIDNSEIQQKISLRTFERILESAKNDENIKGIYLNIENVTISFNKAEKVREMLLKFKNVKPIYSFCDI